MMSVGLIRQATDLRYTGFYIPLLSAVYLHNEGASGLLIGRYHFPPLHGPLFQISLVIILLGAVVNHGMYRSIFGVGGPRQNPKNKWTVRYQRLALLFWKYPKIRPSSLSEAEDRLVQAIDRATTSTLTTTLVLGRFLYLGFVRLAYGVLSLAVFIMLASTVIADTIDYLGFGLLTAQAMFLLAPKIWNRFASVVPGSATEWIFVPEHRRAQTLLDDEDIEFQRDPRGIYEDIMDKVDMKGEFVESASNETEPKYLVPLNEEEEPEYLIPLEQETEERTVEKTD